MFKSTKSFELITLLEKSLMLGRFNKIKNLLLFMMKYKKYEFLTKRKINSKKITNKEIMDLYIELFKEYFYLKKQSIVIDTIPSKSIFNYTMLDNSIIDCAISYNYTDGEILILRIQYNIIDGYYNIYIDTSRMNNTTSGFNLTEKNLDIFQIKGTVIILLNLFFSDILYILIELFGYYRSI